MKHCPPKHWPGSDPKSAVITEDDYQYIARVKADFLDYITSMFVEIAPGKYLPILEYWRSKLLSEMRPGSRTCSF